MYYLLYIGLVFTLYLILLTIKKAIVRPNPLAFIMLLSIYALSFLWRIIEIEFLSNYPTSLFIPFLVSLQGPFILIVVKSYFTNLKFKQWNNLVFFLPQILIAILFISNFAANSNIENISNFHKLFNIQVTLILATSNTVFCLFSLYYFKSNNKIYEIDRPNNSSWVYCLILSALVLYSIYLFICISSCLINILSLPLSIDLSLKFASILIIFTSYFLVSKTDNKANINNSINNEDGICVKGNKEFESLLLKINNHILDNNSFTNPEYSIDNLSNELHIKKNRIVSLFSDYLNTSFNDYLNKHRIDDYKRKCLSGKYINMSITGVAYESGFNSKATFYRTFKKVDTLPPRHYYEVGLNFNETCSNEYRD